MHGQYWRQHGRCAAGFLARLRTEINKALQQFDLCM
jgi:hypothetical protein